MKWLWWYLTEVEKAVELEQWRRIQRCDVWCSIRGGYNGFKCYYAIVRSYLLPLLQLAALFKTVRLTYCGAFQTPFPPRRLKKDSVGGFGVPSGALITRWLSLGAGAGREMADSPRTGKRRRWRIRRTLPDERNCLAFRRKSRQVVACLSNRG